VCRKLDRQYRKDLSVAILKPKLCVTATTFFDYSTSPLRSATVNMSHSNYTPNYPPSTSSTVEVRPPLKPITPSTLPSSASSLPSQLSLPPLLQWAYTSSPATHSPLAKRRASLSNALKLRASHSAPNVTGQGMNEHDPDFPGLPGEKKRNRLGYARTNMACGR
jgi:hypothetical protein